MGIGIGVLVVTLWFFISAFIIAEPEPPNVVKEELTNEEIIERAEALGMVSIENLPSASDIPAELTDNDIVEKAREFGMLFPEEADMTNGKDDVSSISNEELPDSDRQTDTQTNNADEANTSTDETGEDTPKEYVNIRVFAGTTARKVAKLLSENDIVENARDFENYLIEKSATTKIRSGHYSLAKGMDFAEILYLLTTSPTERNN